MSVENAAPNAAAARFIDTRKVGVGAFIALFVAICYFSGVFYKADPKWLGAFDFTTLIGQFGKLANPAGKASTFVGAGGFGARQGFLFAVSLFPGVTLAMGILGVVEHYGALRACQLLLTPFLKPVLGIPGLTGLALITDLQSTDAGAALTKGMYDSGVVTMKQLVVMSAWQYAGAGLIANYFSIVSPLFEHYLVPVWVPLALMLILKFVNGFMVRCEMNTLYRKDFENE